MTSAVKGLIELRDQGRLRRAERESGWVAVLDDVIEVFARGGFEECKRATTTSRRDMRAAGGVWQAVNRATGSVASAIWIARSPALAALLFIEVDGELVEVDRDVPETSDGASRDEGGEA